MQTSFAFLFLGFLLGCAPGPERIQVKLLYRDPDLSAAKEIISLGQAEGTMTARIMVQYSKIGGNWIVRPSDAAPTYNFVQAEGSTAGELDIFWHKASDDGEDLASLDFSAVPLNQTGFSLSIEFLLPMFDPSTGETEHYVVAYGCYQPDSTTTKVTSEILKTALERTGIEVWSGRTCGACPTREEFVNQDHPNFTAAKIFIDKAIPEPCN